MRSAVRLAEREDAQGLVDLLLQMHEECAEHSLAVSKMLHAIAEGIDRRLALVAESEGKVIGSMGLDRTSPWYSNDVCLTDRWFYIRPESRRSKAAFQLVRAAQDMAERHGLPLYLGLASAHDTDRKTRFFMSFDGARQVGGMFRLPGRRQDDGQYLRAQGD